MSRLGKKPIEIPAKTEVTISDDLVTVKGPKGELKINFLNERVGIKQEGDQIIVTPLKKDIETQSLWGTYASLVTNLIKGVNEGFEKKLIIEGVGFKSEVKGQDLVLNVGFSHQVILPIPKELTISVEKNNITVSGIDKHLVGQFAANIRATKKPEPYKGKGIRYIDEVVRRKEGKKAA